MEHTPGGRAEINDISLARSDDTCAPDEGPGDHVRHIQRDGCQRQGHGGGGGGGGEPREEG